MVTGLLDWLKIGVGFVAGVALCALVLLPYDWLVDDPAVADKARQGYVQLATVTALNAQLEEYRRQRDAANAAIAKAMDRADQAKKEAADAQARYDALVAADTSADGAVVDGGDLRWLHDH